MKPVYTEDATKPIQDIIQSMEKEKINSNQSWIQERKVELIQKMKEDTDNKEYPIMFNILTLLVIGLCLYHTLLNQAYYTMAIMVLAISYYVFISRKLKKAIVKLQEDREDIDDYMHDGFYIKDTRLTAVKFGYLIFFPVICILSYQIIEDAQTLPIWQYIIPAAIISSLAWFIFFSDDQGHLDALDMEMKGLIALGESS